MRSNQALTQWTASFGFFLFVAILILVPLALNRGYFNHDELQWLQYADVDSLDQIPWLSWSALQAFQYRPLTFNLWLTLAHYIGYMPVVMHSVVALMGLANACLLRACAMRLGASARAASIGSIVFLLSPCVVYTHAWVGTLADLLCLMFLLLSILWLCRTGPQPTTFADHAKDILPIAVLTALALLSKESAIVIPVLLWSAWPVRRERVLAPFIASLGVVAGYLALRAAIILYAPRSPGAYTWSLANIPLRLADYALFPFYPDKFEIIGLARAAPGILLPALCVIMLLAAVARADKVRAAWFAIGWAACLGPVLILDTSSNIYAYIASAFVCGFLAVHAGHMSRLSGSLLLLPAGLAIGHGVMIGQQMHHVGAMQRHLYADLERLLPLASASEPLRIRAQNSGDDGILRRLVFLVPTYRRLPLADRVEAIAYQGTTEQPNYVMRPSGRLVPIESGEAQSDTTSARNVR